MLTLAVYLALGLVVLAVSYWIAMFDYPQPTLVDAFKRAKATRAHSGTKRSINQYVLCEKTNRWRDRETKRFVKASVVFA